MTEQEFKEGSFSHLPIGKNEDVEFSAELADADDLEAQKRAAAADARAEKA
ncbi:YfhD family protein [Paenibacillus xanthanilyticus]|uniref:YfhD family protein n=1 Tax=Paenibacillus xanthanilyticus TaxID=1783531 RepID=A0ABV8KDA3_9BACL